jgi:DNA processing protein
LLVVLGYARIRIMEDIKYWVALNRVPQLGTVRFRRLEAHFGVLANAWQASYAELKAAGIDDRPAREIVAARGRVSPDAEIERMSLAGVKSVDWHHPEYPPRLKEIHDPPPVLYYKGTLLPADEWAVAVVGTRGPTTYGREAAAALTTDLARHGITIVSGLARGHRRCCPPGSPGRRRADHRRPGQRLGHGLPPGARRAVPADPGAGGGG